jgi:hypothetical protein
MNSMTVLIAHLTVSERFWVGDVAMAAPSARNRALEFQTRDMDKDALTRSLEDIHNFVKSAFESLHLTDPEESHWTNKDGRQVSVGWAIAHALEHTAMHVGHIQILRQLWEQK